MERTLVVTLPGDADVLHRVITYLVILAPDLVQLLTWLKNSHIASYQALNLAITRRFVVRALC